MSRGNQRALNRLVSKIEACRICAENPVGVVLPHEPRPVLRVSATARICVCGQAPGTKVHASGMPFTDPSGVRLRDWMGIGEDVFYDASRIAIVPMGFCFPGQDKKGADLPPRRECSKTWHDDLFELLPAIELLLLVGRYAQVWHLRRLGLEGGKTLTETVSKWRDFDTDGQGGSRRSIVPLPHPSWRNNAWIKKNPWFDRELIPHLQARVSAVIGADT